MLPANPTDHDTNKRDVASNAEQQRKKRKIDSVATAKKPAAQLEKWAMKRQELKNEIAQPSTGQQRDLSEFADLNQMCCLLCKRKFQSVEEIQKHERMSKLHEVQSQVVLKG
jgi:RNA-binding protein 5/10